MKRLFIIETSESIVEDIIDATDSSLENIKKYFLSKIEDVCFDCKSDWEEELKTQIDDLKESDLYKDEYIFSIDGFDEYGYQIGYTLWSKFINCKGE